MLAFQGFFEMQPFGFGPAFILSIFIVLYLKNNKDHMYLR